MFIADPGSRQTMFTAEPKPSRTSTLRPAVLLAAVAALAGAAAPAVAAADSSARPTTCRPVAVRTVYGGRIARNSLLSRIQNGKVLALDVNTGAARTIRFGRGSGRWLTSQDGQRFAMADQAISHDGHPGGGYVIAADSGKDGRVRCAGISELRASAADSASVAADGNLPGIGYTETIGSSSNVHQVLTNYAPLEICLNTRVHPDGVPQTRHPSADTWCFQGPGGYLNDPNGMERGPDGEYVDDGGYHRHFVNYNNGTVAGAKRPNINPSTGKVMPGSPLVWRIYAPKVLTTNGFGF